MTGLCVSIASRLPISGRLVLEFASIRPFLSTQLCGEWFLVLFSTWYLPVRSGFDDPLRAASFFRGIRQATLAIGTLWKSAGKAYHCFYGASADGQWEVIYIQLERKSRIKSVAVVDTCSSNIIIVPFNTNAFHIRYFGEIMLDLLLVLQLLSTMQTAKSWSFQVGCLNDSALNPPFLSHFCGLCPRRIYVRIVRQSGLSSHL